MALSPARQQHMLARIEDRDRTGVRVLPDTEQFNDALAFFEHQRRPSAALAVNTAKGFFNQDTGRRHGPKFPGKLVQVCQLSVVLFADPGDASLMGALALPDNGLPLVIEEVVPALAVVG